MSKGLIKLPRTFFQKERDQLYVYWPFAFWRELCQNSADARSSLIEIKVREHGDHCIVSFDDDGWGMDLDTFRDVYFSLGETTKTDGWTLGGYGRARILTHFSQPSYEIRTQDLHVRGSGAEFEIITAGEPITGCRMVIEVDAPAEKMLMELRRYLALSQLPCAVEINGEAWTEWALKKQHVTDLALEEQKFASVYVAQEGQVGLMIVRVNGTAMFSERIRASVQVVIELEPSLSRSVMTGNRDSFSVEYAGELRKFINTVSVNPQSALKRRPEPIQRLIPRDGALRTVSGLDFDGEAKTLEDCPSPDIYFIAERDRDSAERMLHRFTPPAWSEAASDLLLFWTHIIQEVIPHLLRIERKPSLRWATGWYFGEESAKYFQFGDVAVFCLNPLVPDGKRLRYSLNTQSGHRMLAVAKHEAAHTFHTDHDENFATALSALDSAFNMSVRTVEAPCSLSVLLGRIEERKLHSSTDLIEVDPSAKKLTGATARFIILRMIAEHGELSRRDCIEKITKAYPISSLSSTAGAHHWSHPEFTRMKQAGLLVTTGRKQQTENNTQSEIYRLTDLGRQILDSSVTKEKELDQIAAGA